jgi:hypothetical protein
MKFSGRMFVISTLVLLIAGLEGCSSKIIGLRPGYDRVSLADASQVTNCQSKGEDTVSVLAKVVGINRSEEEVEANMYQIARNYAVDIGADTVVKGESKQFGERTFKLYKCRP